MSIAQHPDFTDDERQLCLTHGFYTTCTVDGRYAFRSNHMAVCKEVEGFSVATVLRDKFVRLRVVHGDDNVPTMPLEGAVCVAKHAAETNQRGFIHYVNYGHELQRYVSGSRCTTQKIVVRGLFRRKDGDFSYLGPGQVASPDDDVFFVAHTAPKANRRVLLTVIVRNQSEYMLLACNVFNVKYAICLGDPNLLINLSLTKADRNRINQSIDDFISKNL